VLRALSASSINKTIDNLLWVLSIAQGRVCWRVAAFFAVPAAVGAYVGTIAGASVSPRALILAFVPVMLIAAVMTYARGTQKVDQGDARPGCPQPGLRRSGPSGLVVGVMTGFFGVGGGFLVVPALTSLLGLSLRRRSRPRLP
jgi:uncharacterized protein